MQRVLSPGLQIVAIGVLHEGVGFALGAEPLRAALADGWFGAIDGSYDRMAMFWFLWFGLVLVLLGGAIRSLEARGPVPAGLIAGTLAMVIGGALTMPISGFWFALVPVAGMVAGHLRRGPVP